MLPAAEVSPVRTSLGGHVEHLLVYAATALLAASAYLDHSRIKIAVSLDPLRCRPGVPSALCPGPTFEPCWTSRSARQAC